MHRPLYLALTGLLLAILVPAATAQSLKPVSASVERFIGLGGTFYSQPLFTAAAAPGKDIDNAVEGAQFLRLDLEELKTLVAREPEALSLTLPYHGTTVEVELLKTQVVTPDFEVITSEKDRAVAVDAGVHYRGRIHGQPNSLTAFSFFKNGEVMAMLSDEVYGDRVLGKLDANGNKDMYILYEDTKLKKQNPMVCGTPDQDQREETGTQSTTEVNGCVRVYLEADYELFQNKGSAANVTTYLTGVFNQVATLYANEQISTQVSTIFVWTTPDNYSNTSSNTALDQFKALRTTFNGDIAHLASLGGNNIGGVAYIDVICSNNYHYAYSNISASFQTVPTYSWTVEVLTHEMGHNLGSNHTQWCGWTGGALDNCYATETGCPPGPAPTNGGTIMSYCHLTSVGINFNNGFGTQPGNKIRTRVSAASCLAAACSASTSCGTPSGLSTSSITQIATTLNWTTVSGATSYNIQWKTAAASTWSTISGITGGTYILGGLTAATAYNFQVQANCNGTLGTYSSPANFTTASATSCGIPASLSATSITQSGATLNWGAIGGATSYNLQWKLNSASTWTTVSNLVITSYNLSSLTAGTSYNFQIQTNCNGTLSTYSSPATFTTAAGTSCGTPSGLTVPSVTTTSAALKWTTLSGATSYNLQWKLNSASTWTTVTGLTGTTYNLTGLAAGTMYNFQMQANCNGSLGVYSASVTFTTAGGASCGIPIGLSATAITSTDATLIWGSLSGATSYNLQWKAASASTWTTVSGLTGLTYNLSGLSLATSYNFKVQANCNGTLGTYSATATFTTSAASCSDSYEPNGSRTAAKVIPVNTNINAQIASSTDVDWYRFSNMGTAKNIKVDLTTLPADYNVALYLNSTQLAIAQTTGTVNEQIIWNTGTVTSAYYLYVYPTGGASSNLQCYTLRVSLSATPWTQAMPGEGETIDMEVPVVTEGFTLYPNPADQTMTLDIPLDDDNTSVSIAIMDMSGRMVLQQQPTLSKGDNQLSFPMQEMAAGVYMVQVRKGDKQHIRKLVVQH